LLTEPFVRKYFLRIIREWEKKTGVCMTMLVGFWRADVFLPFETLWPGVFFSIDSDPQFRPVYKIVWLR